MSFHLSDSLPTFRQNSSGDDFNEYRLRQGCVEFRANHGAWRILDKSEVQLHFVLHTQVAKWLKSQSTNGNGLGAITDNGDEPRDS